jgi:hypothetical protein
VHACPWCGAEQLRGELAGARTKVLREYAEKVGNDAALDINGLDDPVPPPVRTRARPLTGDGGCFRRRARARMMGRRLLLFNAATKTVAVVRLRPRRAAGQRPWLDAPRHCAARGCALGR